MDITSLPPRIKSKIRVDEDGCWHWTAATTSGYGVIYVHGAGVRRAHRVVYSLLVGDPGAEKQLDHLCRVRHCVNPKHLEPVTQQENIRRGEAKATALAKFSAPRNCPAGHPMEGENLYVYLTRAGYPNRQCRQCRRETKQRRRAAGSRD